MSARLRRALPLLAAALEVGCGGASEAEALIASPARIDFPSVLVGRALVRTLRLDNTLDRPLVVEHFAPEPALTSAFSIAAPLRVVPKRDAVDVSIIFRPDRAGRWLGGFDLRADGLNLRVPVTGSARRQTVFVDPPLVDFGPVRIRETRRSPLRLDNEGPTPIELAAVVTENGSSVDFALRLGTNVRIPPGGRFETHIEFSPSSEGARSAAFVVVGADAQVLARVSARGDGFFSVLEAEPPSVAFRGVLVDTSQSRTVRIRNRGFVPTAPLQLGLTGTTAPDLRLLTPNAPPLAPGAFAAFDLVFTPRRRGEQRATLVALASGLLPLQVPVLASADGPEEPEVVLSEATLDFGRIETGRRTERFTRVSLEGSVSLPPHRALIEPPGAPFSLASALGRLDPGDRRRLVVVAEPQTTGPLAATLRIGRARMALTAEAVPELTAELELWPRTLDFGSIAPGESATRRLVLRSLGRASLGPLEWTLTGPLRLATTAPRRLSPGQEVVLRTRLDRSALVGGAPTLGALAVSDGVQQGRASVRAEALFSMEPPGLEVILRWEGDADLNLHLAQIDADPFDPAKAATFCSPNPDWGLSARALDDPWLSADADRGPAEERIRIVEPSEPQYRVEVSWTVDGAAASVDAEVEVWALGMRVATRRRMLARGRRWVVGTVRLSGERPSLELAPEGLIIETRRFCE